MKKIMMALLALMFIFALSSASQAAVKANYNKSMPKSVCFEVAEGDQVGQQIVVGTKKATKVEFPPTWEARFPPESEEGKSVKANVHLVQAFSSINEVEEVGEQRNQQGMGTGTGTAYQEKGTDDEGKVDNEFYHAEWHSTYSTGPTGQETWTEAFDLYWEFVDKDLERAEIWIKDEFDQETRGYQLDVIDCKTGEVKYLNPVPNP